MRNALLALLAIAFASPPETRSTPAPPSKAKPADGASASADGGTASFAGSGLIAKSRLTPPSKPGTSRFEVEGCAAHPERAMDQPPARALPPTGTAVEVQPLRRGAMVVHELTHACCLKANVTTQLEKKVATVHETLSGNPCRCMCSSTLRTALALPPGTYQLVVELERDKKVEKVHEQALSVH